MSAVGWIGWTLFSLLLIWHWQRDKYNQGKRFNLSSYVIYLLLSDKIREDHKRKFQEWIHGTEVENVMSFGQGVHDVAEEMTGKLAEKELVLTATAMVLKYKAGEWEG